MIVKKRIKRSEEELRQEALKYFRKVDFQNLSNSHYKQSWRKGKEFLDDICSHMDLQWEEKWKTIDDVMAEARKYTQRTEFARKSSGAYSKAQAMGWLDLVCSFMGEKTNAPYTLEELKDIVAKCKNREDLRKNYLGAHNAIYNRGLADELLTELPLLWEQKWDSAEKIHKEALKYKRRFLFKENSSGAWDAAIRLGILDQVCSHMQKAHSVSFKEQELLFKIKEIFDTAKSVRYPVNIADKPHIKRFDLDIYLPNLKKGIEFDGTYYHSFEGLKRGRKHWSDEDIRNYHELKDSWFASQGIQILHIKEEDWNRNKEECIQKCLDFLGKEDVKAA